MRLGKFNQKLAVWGTDVFSSMGAFWLFLVWGLLGVIPWFPDAFKQFVLLISSAWIQLWALPLIAVGSALRNKASERRATQDHQILMSELAMMKRNQNAHQRTIALLEEVRREQRAAILGMPKLLENRMQISKVDFETLIQMLQTVSTKVDAIEKRLSSE